MAHGTKEEKKGCVRLECAKPKVWNDSKCRCDCPKSVKCFAVGAVFNPDTCSWCIPQKCEEGKTFNNQTCKCECKPHDTPPQEWLWDENKCEAVCNRSCSSPHVIDSTSCTCGCPNASSLGKEDSLIKQWNNATCRDECKESTRQGVDANNTQKAYLSDSKWYNDTCSCRCYMSQNYEFPVIEDSDTCGCKCGCIGFPCPQRRNTSTS